MLLEEKNGLKFFKSEKLLSIEGINHAFTTRIGGISPKPYNSLNIYSTKEEEKDNSLANRKKLGEVLNINIEKAVLAQQVHDNKVHKVINEDSGRGFFDHKTAIPETDALVTNEKNQPIMLLYADCLPLIIVDKKNLAVGVVHAGWKGTALEISKKTVEKMVHEYQSKLDDIYVAIGVGINKCCFEIQKDAQEKLSKVSYSNNCFEIRDNKIFANLVEINKSQLINMGIPEQNIDDNEFKTSYGVSTPQEEGSGGSAPFNPETPEQSSEVLSNNNKNLCTFCNEEYFFSYRRDNQVTGRHSAIVWIN
ncbi:MAG: peptidoglycan editing factor PgeF [Candidatus Sericytochromatia bacterium]